MSGARDSRNPNVTDAGVADRAGATTDAVNRDCRWCGKPIGAVEVLYLCGRSGMDPCHADCARVRIRLKDAQEWNYWTEDGDVPDFAQPYNVHAPDYDPWRDKCWQVRNCEVCGQQVRGQGEKAHAACSPECKDKLPAAAARARRRQMREAEIPESFTCAGCEKPIEGTVVVTHGGTSCEPCYVEVRRESARRGNIFTAPVDPDDPDWSPWPSWMGDPVGCGHCGRSIRGYEFCCDRCKYEADKAARRVSPKQKKCEGCGEMFTPKRSDAKTCSDRCRQALRRKKKSSRIAASPAAAATITDADNRDPFESLLPEPVLREIEELVAA